MSYIRLFLMFLLLLLAALFIVSNNTEVQLSLALVPYKTPHLPIWLVVAVVAVVAYFAGILSRLLPHYSTRRRLKRAETDLAAAQAQLRATAQQLNALQAATLPPAPPPPQPSYD